MATRYDISIDQGSTCVLAITLIDDSGLPVNLTGFNAQSMIRYTFNDVSPAVVFAPSIDAVNNILTLTLSAAQTATLNRTKALWDCELIFPDGTIQRLVEGQVMIRFEVTK